MEYITTVFPIPDIFSVVIGNVDEARIRPEKNKSMDLFDHPKVVTLYKMKLKLSQALQFTLPF